MRSESGAGSGGGVPRPLRKEIARRTFIGGAVAAGTLAYVAPRRFAVGGVKTVPISDVVNPGNPIADFAIAAERDTDLILLDFSFYGLSVTPAAGTSPASISPYTADNFIVVQFPPQAIGEATYPWQGDDLPVDPAPVLSDLSGPSQLVFQLQVGQTIPLPNMNIPGKAIEDLLDWSGWTLLVPPVAQVQGPFIIEPVPPPRVPFPTPPTQFQTFIEFPYDLFLAPTVYITNSPVISGFTTTFTSRAEPLVSEAGVADLWSAALSGAPLGNPVILPGQTPPPPFVPQVSAVWAVDNPDPFFPVPSDTHEQHINYAIPTT